MKNICDIYYEKKLFHIVLDTYEEYKIPQNVMYKTAIAVNLYYIDTVKKYLTYLNKVPKEIDIYIISSNKLLLSEIEDFALNRKNVKLIEKENRGRDISALLVIFKHFVKKYKYICFIHDKKPNYDFLKEDTDLWVYNLWNNTLKTENYIKNIIGLLMQEDIGMLIPPKPIGDHIDNWYANVWYKNYDNTIKLAQKLGIGSNIITEQTPFALGTVFWAKTKALEKLFNVEWNYKDFPEEPMPTDGTISHAIERILPYIVQDAGYETHVIVSKDYAEKLILIIQKMMEDSFEALWKRFKIRNVYQLMHYAEQENEVKKIFCNCKHIYLYGTGDYGKRFLELLKLWGYIPDGFVVTNGYRKETLIEGYPIYELQELNINESNGFIICTNYHLQDEIEQLLLSRGFHHYFKVILG